MTTVLRVDMHLHTDASPDSSLTVEEAIETAKSKGLAGIAVTDHNTMEAVDSAVKLGEEKGLLVIPGVEVSTKEGHLLVYGVRSPPAADVSMADTIGEVHEARGIAVMSHPFRRFHGAGRRVDVKGLRLDGIETFNGHTSEGSNDLARKLAEEVSLKGIGGSDAHNRAEIGNCYTEFTLVSSDVRKLLNDGSPIARGVAPDGAEVARVGLGNAGKRILRGFKPL